VVLVPIRVLILGCRILSFLLLLAFLPQHMWLGQIPKLGLGLGPKLRL
jgi:hypothetical protein